MSTDKQNLAKKQVANDIFKQLNPHFSALLGSNIGYGVSTSSNSMAQDFNTALRQWFEQDNADELVGFLRTAQVTNVISETELNNFLDEIDQAN
jgi:hypothetical protein